MILTYLNVVIVFLWFNVHLYSWYCYCIK